MSDISNGEIDLIDVGEEHSSEETLPNSFQLPVNFISFGETEPGDIKVYINQAAYKSIEKLAQSDTSKELGSFLVGTVEENLGSFHVIITDVIEAKFTDASASTLTFTHETWEYVHQQMADKYPDKKILGWQHTHPSYGIFLSNYDMFIQENFFNLPFQVAYVIDPVQHLRGFFQWKENKVQKLSGFFVYDDVGKEIRLNSLQKREKNQKQTNGGKFPTAWLAIMSAAIIALGIVCGTLFGKLSKISKEQQEYCPTPSETEQAVPPQSETDSELIELESRLSEAKNLIEEQEDRITQLEKALEEEQKNLHFVKYTVQAGDSIYHICVANGLDFVSTKDIIKGVNGLDENYSIFAGQDLWIPEN